MSFLNPLLLVGVLAAAIPIVLHLIQRRQAKILPIATLRFLRTIPARTIRRRRLEEYLLLLARALLLALLAFGAARPVLTGAEARGGATAVAIVIDDSWSMDRREAGITRFTAALEAGLQVARTLSNGDRAAVIPASAPSAETLTGDLAGVRRRLGSLSVSVRAPDLLRAVRKGLDLLADAPEPNRELVLITDLQGRAVQPLVDGLTLDEEDERVRVALVDLGRADAGNLTLTRVEAGSGVAIAGEPMRVSAVVANRSTAAKTTRVSLFLGGERVAEIGLTVEPGEPATATFETTADLPGAAHGRVVLEGDDLSPDDTRWFALPVVGRIPVLLVNGDPSPIAFQDEAFFLRAALSPEDLGAEKIQSPVNLKVVERDALNREDLTPYEVLILANVSSLEPRAAIAVRAFVKSGGGLLYFGGNRVDTRLANSDLGTDDREGLLPAVLSPPAQIGADDRVIPLAEADPDHPLFAGLPPEAFRDLSQIHVRRALSADPKPSGGRVIARLQNRQPLIVERTAGRGRVILVTTSADSDWGNLPIRPLFLPFVHRAVMLLAGGGGKGTDFQIGDLVPIAPRPAGEPAPEITDPRGDVRRLAGPTDREGNLPYGPLDMTGVYRTSDGVVFTANVDGAEGDLTRADPDRIANMFASEKFRVITDLTELTASLTMSREGRPIWGFAIGAALLLLLFEGWFGNRIARARARRAEEAAA